MGERKCFALLTARRVIGATLPVMSASLKGNLCALIMALIWSGSFICIRIVRAELDYLTMFPARFVPSLALLIPLWFVFRRRQGAARLDWRGMLWMIPIGILAGPLG